jgi:hypothetical protein
MNMKCKKIKDLLFAYQDGQLAELEKEEFERHLRACPACSARLEEMRKIDGRLQAAAAPVLPDADFDKSWRKINAAIRPAPRRQFSFFPAPRWAMLTMGFLAFFVLGIVVARLYFSPARTEITAPAAAPFLYSAGDYFAALQPVFSEYSNAAGPSSSDTADPAQVRLLLNNLQLLRLRAEKNKDTALLRLLNDIELVLLEIVHLDRSNPENARLVGVLIQEKGIAMKMKVFKFDNRKTVRI